MEDSLEKKGTRRIDELGRLVIPISIRKAFDINVGDHVEFFVDYSQNSIIIKKYNNSCTFCGSSDHLKSLGGKYICHDCISKISSLR